VPVGSWNTVVNLLKENQVRLVVSNDIYDATNAVSPVQPDGPVYVPSHDSKFFHDL
tara:strand:- start:563 stop:730 length:168 start_codon:yes stop_codon:yes gene_type:complete